MKIYKGVAIISKTFLCHFISFLLLLLTLRAHKSTQTSSHKNFHFFEWNSVELFSSRMTGFGDAKAAYCNPKPEDMLKSADLTSTRSRLCCLMLELSPHTGINANLLCTYRNFFCFAQRY